MKNILFSLLISSASLIYSTDINTIKVKQQEELEPLYEQSISSLSSEEEEIDFDTQDFEEEIFFNNSIANERYSVDGWKVVIGLAGLWLGTKFFFFGSKGAFFLLMSPDHISNIISRSSNALSPMEKLLTNRPVCLSLCSTLIIFSLWILEKSADSLYQGLYTTKRNDVTCSMLLD